MKELKLKMMRNYLYLLPVLLIVASCNGQEKPKAVHSEQTKGENPKVDIKVNKKYDSKGNLIRYDSTYSYVYTTKGRDSLKIGTDTLFDRFKSYYHKNVSDLFDDKMENIFFNDTLFKYDFLNEDFFTKRFELNTRRMNEIFMQMDSLKNKFLQETNKNVSSKEIKK